MANLEGWFTTVVARVRLDMLRSRKSRREEPLDPDEAVAAVAGGGACFAGGGLAALACTTPLRLHGIPQEFLGHAKRAAILERIGLGPQSLALGIVEDMTALADGRAVVDVEQPH